MGPSRLGKCDWSSFSSQDNTHVSGILSDLDTVRNKAALYPLAECTRVLQLEGTQNTAQVMATFTAKFDRHRFKCENRGKHSLLGVEGKGKFERRDSKRRVWCLSISRVYLEL